MKTLFLSLAFAGLYFFAGAVDNKTSKTDFGFAKHSAEIAVTPNVGYFIYNKSFYSYSSYRPFAGIAVGGQYVYRPISLLAVSTGVNFHMQGIFYKPRWFSQGVTMYESSIQHTGYLMVPVYFHVYKHMRKSTFEFAIGPDFYIPVFRRATIRGSNTFDGQNNSDTQLDEYSPEQMRKNAVMGLSVFLGAQLHLSKKADLFIGPHIGFLDVVRFNSMSQRNRADYGGFYNVYMGLKIGFRLHSAGKKEASR